MDERRILRGWLRGLFRNARVGVVGVSGVCGHECARCRGLEAARAGGCDRGQHGSGAIGPGDDIRRHVSRRCIQEHRREPDMDSSEHWAGERENSITSIVLDPASPGTVYVASWGSGYLGGVFALAKGRTSGPGWDRVSLNAACSHWRSRDPSCMRDRTVEVPTGTRRLEPQGCAPRGFGLADRACRVLLAI